MAKKSEGLTDVELQSQVAHILSDCDTFVEEELSPDRVKATDYFLGRAFGNEEEGRSQIVLTEVADAIQAVLPSLLRVVHGPERVVQYAPRTKDDVAIAEQASDYAQFVYAEDNPGFLTTHAVLTDGLVGRLGVIKWGWDETSTVEAHKLSGVTEEQLYALLESDESIELTRVEALGDGTHTVELTRRAADGRARVWAIPPEEFGFNREARSTDEALCVYHRTEKSKGELVAMGIDEDVLEEHGHRDASKSDSEDVIARSVGEASGDDPEAGEANDKVTYIEAYIRLDVDGDGVAELRKICTIGPGHFVVMNEPADCAPFAIFVPLPTPHTIIGRSYADRTMDLQLLKSSLVRSSLDALAQSIFPRTAIVEGQVEIDDVLNTEIGAIIRQRAPGMVQPFNVPFAGKEIFPFIEWADSTIERRIGVNKGAAGLDADALQSSTAGAVNAAVTQSQAQTELLARVFAEMTLKPLFRGLLKLLVAKQPRARMAKLRGEWVEVDPAAWDANMDVTVNVALGSTLVEQKIQALAGIAQKQELVLSTLGPSNPLVTAAQYRHTLARLTELAGFKDVESFWQKVDPNWQPPAPPQPPQDPTVMLAQAQIQIEQMKAQKDIEIKQAELALKQQEMQLRDDRERDKQAADFRLRQLELELKHHAQLNTAQLNAEVQRERNTTMAGPGSDTQA